MKRSRLAALVIIVVAVCVSPSAIHAQAQEECMDCVDKLTVGDEEGTGSSEALCCDAPSAGDWVMSQEDVGWACRVKQVSGAISGTVCDSGTEDQGCPPPPPPDGPGGPITLCDDGSYTGQCSPIIINLADGPWKLSGADDPVSFDIDGDGQPNRITWTGRGASLAFLALDVNANGTIDTGAELFGTGSRLRSGERAPNGFEALMERDANSDGVVDATDPVWSRLLLWTDVNHNGVSEPGEMSAIADSEVVALNTDYRGVQRRDAADNTFRFMSSLRLERGQRIYYDVFFRSVR